MDKYLLLMGFQLTQTALLGAIDGSSWRILARGDWHQLASGLDGEAFGLLLQTLLSGTWVGRVTDIGGTLVALVRGAEGLPLALIVLQWIAVIGVLRLERNVLRRRLERIAARG